MGEKLPELLQPEASWEVRYISGQADEPISVPRRDFDAAMSLAKFHRTAGRKVQLLRVEKTEVDF